MAREPLTTIHSLLRFDSDDHFGVAPPPPSGAPSVWDDWRPMGVPSNRSRTYDLRGMSLVMPSGEAARQVLVLDQEATTTRTSWRQGELTVHALLSAGGGARGVDLGTGAVARAQEAFRASLARKTFDAAWLAQRSPRGARSQHRHLVPGRPLRASALALSVYGFGTN